MNRNLLNSVLDHWPVARLATTSKTGAPHIVPVVFCRDGDVLYLPVDGKRKRHQNLQRLQNLRRHPQCALLLDHYSDKWDQLWWVRLDCTAISHQPGEADYEELRLRFVGKYPQYQTLPLSSGKPTLLQLRWTNVSAWSQSGLDVSIEESLRRR